MTTLILKAETPFPYRRLHRVADEYVPDFVGPFLASVRAARGRVSDTEVEQSFRTGNPSGALVGLLDRIVVAKAAEPAELARRVYERIVSATVLDMVDYVERQLGQPAAQIVGSFNVTNPYVKRAAATLTADLIRGVGAETKQAVRRIIFESVRDGVAPADAAKLIRQVVGLTSRQALQVSNLRASLVADGRSAQTVDRLSGRLSNRLLRDRALTIARTETMRAANVGQQQMWEAMADQGVLDRGTFRQEWLVTPDDRLCPRCAPMGGRSVQLGFLFRETEVGVLPSERRPVAGTTVVSPPLHPRCRCVLVAVVGDVVLPAAPSVAPQPQPTVVRPVGPQAPSSPASAVVQPTPTRGKGVFTDKTVEALRPARQWSKEGVDAVRDAMSATEEGKVLFDTLDRFQDGGSIARLRNNIAKELAGEQLDPTSQARARAVINALRDAPEDWAPDTLYRGMSIKGKIDNVLAKYVPGETLDLNLTSFSSARSKAVEFANNTRKAGDTRVIVELVGDGKKTIPIQNMARDRRLFPEKEFVSGGRYRILEAKKAPGGNVLLRIEQVGAL